MIKEDSRYQITIQYDENNEIWDVNIYDGCHSISVDRIDDIPRILKELERME